MLGSLIKFEFKSTYKIFFGLYALVIFFSLANIFIIDFNSIEYLSSYSESNIPISGIIMAVFFIVYIILLITVGVMTIFIIVKRFYNNMFGDTGYLMNTIPVEPWKNIVSKLVVASFWLFFGVGICFLSVIILLTHKVPFSELFDDIVRFIGRLDGEDIKLICCFFVSAIIQQITNIMIVYCSMSIGQLFNNNKKIIAFGVFIAINAFLSFISGCILTGAETILGTAVRQMDNVFIMSILINIVIFAGTFIATNFILKNKLNLE